MEVRFCIDDIDDIVESIGRSPDCAIPILQAIQDRYRFLPEPALLRVCEITDITPAAIEGVASFYAQFRRTPVGRHTISVCDGTACHVKGATEVYDAVVKQLSLGAGQDTDAKGEFTVRKVACLGCCTLAPAVQIDEVTYGHVQSNAVGHILHDFLVHEGERKPEHIPLLVHAEAAAEIRVGLGSCCVAGGSDKVRVALEDALTEIDTPVNVKHVSCVGMCHQTPLLEFVVPGSPAQLYAKVQPEDVPGIVARHFKPRRLPVRLLRAAVRRLEGFYADETRHAVERSAVAFDDAPVAAFIAGQKRLATEYCGEINPLDINEYKSKDGFVALDDVLSGKPEGVIERIARSGLRGRGGAGFPTARKWQAVRDAEGERKFIVCNGDEGDPGAFMDRMMLESYPYRVIEGMLIASFAAGANEGVIYIRAEYPLAVRRVKEAIKRCEAAGHLGDDIRGSGHRLKLRVMEAAGAFVCGEETALIASIEGRRGMPSYRPPFPAERGLMGCPTLVNNVETYALVPWILRNGPDVFAKFGTEHSKGTKVFSLTGKVRRGGLIEVPMGVTIRRIVEEIGGGCPEGRTFKAVQVGGPSGGCIPASLGDTPVDYEALAQVGAMMGSGGLVVLDDTDCMVEISRYFIEFMQRESCGKCTPCRVGTKRMLEILTRLCAGEAVAEDLDQLESLALRVKTQSLCGLGKTAPNPVLTTLRYFRDEFEAHVAGQCPAKACRKLVRYSVTDACIGCTKCAQVCPVDAIELKPYEVHSIDTELCTRCDACRPVCPVDAVIVE
ncbi:MAG: NAD(P)H-dependent oxidoreductase subunit E [FCB group bacterium]|jgi:NADH-quinone oxidoreductase subunit F|nr:NAD(P)H-dependent oxidoreductase subunit E [FCB group bacterium]